MRNSITLPEKEMSKAKMNFINGGIGGMTPFILAPFQFYVHVSGYIGLM